MFILVVKFHNKSEGRKRSVRRTSLVKLPLIKKLLPSLIVENTIVNENPPPKPPMAALWILCVLVMLIVHEIHGEDPGTYMRCDILIVGGSTAAFAAAIAAADDLKEDDLSTVICLTEPTDWLGGQLTSSLISAIDFGKHNRDKDHLPSSFVEMLTSIGWPGNPGNCWVRPSRSDPKC